MKIEKINKAIDFNYPLIKAKLVSTEGSVPRNKGTFMLISSKIIFGSIGGGQLEFNIINKSREILKQKKIFKEEIINIPLGPSIGQCCGGYVQVKISKYKNGKESLLKEKFLKSKKDNLFIFGAGHVGKELSEKIIDLDFDINLIDSRNEYLNLQKNKKIKNIYLKKPWLLVKKLPKNSYFVVLTHSHDFDFKIINELLKFNNFIFVGLIGSKTKRRRFENRLLKLGHKQSLINLIECPIGLNTITSKKPGEIAISIIARLLEFRSSINNNNFKKILKIKKINE